MGKRSGVEMEKLEEEYARSGLSRKEFSERHGIAVTTLDYYRQRRGKKTTPGLLAVRVEDGATATQFTLSLSNGRRIEGTWDFRDQELTRLIRVAESA